MPCQKNKTDKHLFLIVFFERFGLAVDGNALLCHFCQARMSIMALHMIITSDAQPPRLDYMLEGYDCPAILVSKDYQILAFNRHYQQQFGDIELAKEPRCYKVSHGYDAPCDQSGEDCPLANIKQSGQKERVLHIHQTPRGEEHVDVEMLPIKNENGELIYFVELLHAIPSIEGSCMGGSMVGNSKAFNALRTKISRLSESDASVLLLGESGTGKELAARAIHCGSRRHKGSLVTLECAGLSENLFESELFGHVKGAFTGANNDKPGLVKAANGGTLFLDEIGDVPMSMQVKILRLIETGTYRPVGSSQVKHSNFRLICATHKNIKALIKEGKFREDLYYRINVFPIHMPALRERKEDLCELAIALLKTMAPAKTYHFTESAMQLLRAYDFPGNIRELRNILNRVVVLAHSNVIDAELLKECLDFDLGEAPKSEPASRSITAQDGWPDLKAAEKQYLQQMLAAFDGNREQTARTAGISVRSLYRKLED